MSEGASSTRSATQRPVFTFVPGNDRQSVLPSVGRTSTVPAMQSGIFWGYISMIEGLVARIREERDEEMDVIATGGLAPLFTRSTDVIRIADDELTLRGLLAIYLRDNK